MSVLLPVHRSAHQHIQESPRQNTCRVLFQAYAGELKSISPMTLGSRQMEVELRLLIAIRICSLVFLPHKLLDDMPMRQLFHKVRLQFKKSLHPTVGVCRMGWKRFPRTGPPSLSSASMPRGSYFAIRIYSFVLSLLILRSLIICLLEMVSSIEEIV